MILYRCSILVLILNSSVLFFQTECRTNGKCQSVVRVRAAVTDSDVFHSIKGWMNAWVPTVPEFRPARLHYITSFNSSLFTLNLILLTWRIWWAPNNASKWQMGFNSAFKVFSHHNKNFCSLKHFFTQKMLKYRICRYNKNFVFKLSPCSKCNLFLFG